MNKSSKKHSIFLGVVYDWAYIQQLLAAKIFKVLYLDVL